MEWVLHKTDRTDGQSFCTSLRPVRWTESAYLIAGAPVVAPPTPSM